MTIAPGARIVAADFDPYVDPPRCKAWGSSAVSIANNALTVVTLNSTAWDTAGMHDDVTDNSRITVPLDGVYLITHSGSIVANTSGRRVSSVRLNAAGSGSGGTQIDIVSQAATATSGWTGGRPFEWELQAGDYIELFLFQNSGGALNTGTGQESLYLSARWVGPLA